MYDTGKELSIGKIVALDKKDEKSAENHHFNKNADIDFKIYTEQPASRSCQPPQGQVKEL